MVVGEVGEQRAVERDAVDAPLVEPVRGHFHRHGARAFRLELGKQAVQFERVRGRIFCCMHGAGKSAAQCSNHARLGILQRERMSNPLRAAGLAVGAGDAADPQRFGGTSVELVREEAGLRLEIAHPCVGNFPAAVPGKAFALPKHRRAAPLDSLGDMAPAVGRPARPGEKSRSRRRAPAVGRQALDRRPRTRELRRKPREDIVTQVLSFASSASPGISSGESGAS